MRAGEQVAVNGASQVEAPPRSLKLARNTLHLFAGQMGTMVLGILLSAALGRLLGVKDFGLYFLANSFAAFTIVLVDWGQSYITIREVARAPEQAGHLLGTGLALRAAGMFAAGVPATLAAWALGYDLRTRWFTVAFLLASLPFFLAQNFGVVFRGRDRMDLDAAVGVTNRAVGLVLAIVALKLGFGLGGVMGALGAGGAAALVLAWWFYGRVDLVGPLRFSTSTARLIFREGTPLLMMTIAVYVQPYIDAVVLSKMVTREAIGWYGAAKSIQGTLMAPALILGSAAFTPLSRVAREPEHFREQFAIIQRPMLWLAGLGCVGTWLYASTAISVVYGGRNYQPAGIILQIFALGLFLLFIDMLMAVSLTALSRSKAVASAKIASVAFGLALELLLVPYFQWRTGNGGIGVTVALVVSELVMCLGCAFLLPRGVLGPKVLADGGRAVVCAVGTGVFFHFLPPLTPWLGIPLCIVVFALLSVATGMVHRGDLGLLRALLRRTPGGAPATAPVSDGIAPHPD